MSPDTKLMYVLYILMYIHIKGILDLYHSCSIFLYRQSLEKGWDIEMLRYRLNASEARGKWGMVVWQALHTNGGTYTHLMHTLTLLKQLTLCLIDSHTHISSPSFPRPLVRDGLDYLFMRQTGRSAESGVKRQTKTGTPRHWN